MPQRMRRDPYRSVKIGGTVAALLGVGFFSYQSSRPQYNQVCASNDSANPVRVDDANCERGPYVGNGLNPNRWYYVPTGSNQYVGAVGQPLQGGSTLVPDGRVSKGAIPSTGGKVSRGGFGTHSGGSVGG